MPATGSSRFSRAESVAFAIVFLSLAWATAPRLFAIARDTVRLARVPVEQRHAEEFGTLLRSIQKLPPVPVAVILRDKSDADLGIYVNYFRYPLTTRIYFSWDDYRRDPRAPKVTATIDRRVAWEVRLAP